jgi:Methyltransferase domain
VTGDTVDDLYRLVLRRPPDPEARAAVQASLADGSLTRSALLADLVSSDEFARIRSLEDGIALARRSRADHGRPHGLTGPARTDERVVEVPWALARIRAGRLLDLGTANADPLYVEALVDAAPGAVGLDLEAADLPGLRMVAGDVRRLPFEDGAFDVVVCISTLEHVGSHESPYGGDGDPEAGGIAEALGEIHRVLSARGLALVTVPCGAEEDHGWFVQHTRAGWSALFSAAGFHILDQELYVLGSEGWAAGDDDGAAYGERGPGASAVLCSELHPGRLRHAVKQQAYRLLRRSAS